MGVNRLGLVGESTHGYWAVWAAGAAWPAASARAPAARGDPL